MDDERVDSIIKMLFVACIACMCVLILMAGHTICRMVEMCVEDSKRIETRDMGNAMRSMAEENRQLKHRMGIDE